MKKRFLAALIPLIVFLLCLVTISGCKKDEQNKGRIPGLSVDFTLDKTEYSGGDSLIVTNTSAGADAYEWTLRDPDGNSISNYPPNWINANNFQLKNLPVLLDINSKDGVYTLELKAIRNNDNSSLSISKTFIVKTKRAKVQVSIKTSNYQTFTVYVGNQYLFQSDSQYYPTTTKREFMIPVGKRIFNARWSGVILQRNITVAEGEDYKVTLGY